MSAHKCPNCNDYRFHWSVDEEVTPLTMWNCWECHYHALEDESLESECPDCHYPHRIRLEKEDTKYWWCTDCSTKTLL